MTASVDNAMMNKRIPDSAPSRSLYKTLMQKVVPQQMCVECSRRPQSSTSKLGLCIRCDISRSYRQAEPWPRRSYRNASVSPKAVLKKKSPNTGKSKIKRSRHVERSKSVATNISTDIGITATSILSPVESPADKNNIGEMENTTSSRKVNTDSNAQPPNNRLSDVDETLSTTESVVVTLRLGADKINEIKWRRGLGSSWELQPSEEAAVPAKTPPASNPGFAAQTLLQRISQNPVPDARITALLNMDDSCASPEEVILYPDNKKNQKRLTLSENSLPKEGVRDAVPMPPEPATMPDIFSHCSTNISKDANLNTEHINIESDEETLLQQMLQDARRFDTAEIIDLTRSPENSPRGNDECATLPAICTSVIRTDHLTKSQPICSQSTDVSVDKNSCAAEAKSPKTVEHVVENSGIHSPQPTTASSDKEPKEDNLNENALPQLLNFQRYLDLISLGNVVELSQEMTDKQSKSSSSEKVTQHDNRTSVIRCANNSDTTQSPVENLPSTETNKKADLDEAFGISSLFMKMFAQCGSIIQEQRVTNPTTTPMQNISPTDAEGIRQRCNLDEHQRASLEKTLSALANYMHKFLFHMRGLHNNQFMATLSALYENSRDTCFAIIERMIFIARTVNVSPAIISSMTMFHAQLDQLFSTVSKNRMMVNAQAKRGRKCRPAPRSSRAKVVKSPQLAQTVYSTSQPAATQITVVSANAQSCGSFDGSYTQLQQSACSTNPSYGTPQSHHQEHPLTQSGNPTHVSSGFYHHPTTQSQHLPEYRVDNTHGRRLSGMYQASNNNRLYPPSSYPYDYPHTQTVRAPIYRPMIRTPSSTVHYRHPYNNSAMRTNSDGQEYSQIYDRYSKNPMMYHSRQPTVMLPRSSHLIQPSLPCDSNNTQQMYLTPTNPNDQKPKNTELEIPLRQATLQKELRTSDVPSNRMTLPGHNQPSSRQRFSIDELLASETQRSGSHATQRTLHNSVVDQQNSTDQVVSNRLMTLDGVYTQRAQQIYPIQSTDVHRSAIQERLHDLVPQMVMYNSPAHADRQSSVNQAALRNSLTSGNLYSSNLHGSVPVISGPYPTVPRFQRQSEPSISLPSAVDLSKH